MDRMEYPEEVVVDEEEAKSKVMAIQRREKAQSPDDAIAKK